MEFVSLFLRHYRSHGGRKSTSAVSRTSSVLCDVTRFIFITFTSHINILLQMEPYCSKALDIAKIALPDINTNNVPVWSSSQSSWLHTEAPGTILGATTFSEK
jgi:hypothetical protein